MVGSQIDSGKKKKSSIKRNKMIHYLTNLEWGTFNFNGAILNNVQ